MSILIIIKHNKNPSFCLTYIHVLINKLPREYKWDLKGLLAQYPHISISYHFPHRSITYSLRIMPDIQWRSLYMYSQKQVVRWPSCYQLILFVYFNHSSFMIWQLKKFQKRIAKPNGSWPNSTIIAPKITFMNTIFSAWSTKQTRSISCLDLMMLSLYVQLNYDTDHVMWESSCLSWITTMSWHGHIFPFYWPFVRGFHKSIVDSLHKWPVMGSFDISFAESLNTLLNE